MRPLRGGGNKFTSDTRLRSRSEKEFRTDRNVLGAVKKASCKRSGRS